MVQDAQRHGLALGQRIDGDAVALGAGIGLAEVLQRGQHGDAGGVDEVAVVRQHVHVCADAPDFGAGEQAQGFGVEGGGAAEGFLEDAREEDFGFGGGGGGGECGGGHGG